MLTRQAPGFDSAVISDNAAAALLAVWMHRYFADEAARTIAERTVNAFADDLLAAASGFGGLWQAAAFLAAPHLELAIVGTPEDRVPLEREAARHYLPFVALTPAEEGGDLPVLEGRPGGGQASAARGHGRGGHSGPERGKLRVLRAPSRTFFCTATAPNRASRYAMP